MQAALVGGVGLTLLEVYNQRPGPDGVQGGCAHVHALTDEAYFGLSGAGAVELHDAERGFRSVPIEAGAYVQFPAGTLHRSVSTDNLRVLAVMGNAGLPEHGDARIYFGAEADADAERFRSLKDMVGNGIEGALERRDASAAAYRELMRLWCEDRPAYFTEIDRFVSLHRAAMTAKAAPMARAIETGPLHQAVQAFERLAGAVETAGAAGSWSDGNASVVYGMCGILRPLTDLNEV